MAIGDPTSVQAKTGYGFRFYYDQQAHRRLREVQTWTHIEGMRSGALPSPDKPEIDVTTTIDDVKAFIPGMGAINDISLEFNFYPQNEIHQHLVGEVLYEENPRPWKLEGQGMTFTFFGYLKSANVAFGVDTALQMPLTLKVTTKPIVVYNKETGTEPDPDLPEPEEPGGEDGDENNNGVEGGGNGQEPGGEEEGGENLESRVARARVARHY